MKRNILMVCIAIVVTIVTSMILVDNYRQFEAARYEEATRLSEKYGHTAEYWLTTERWLPWEAVSTTLIMGAVVITSIVWLIALVGLTLKPQVAVTAIILLLASGAVMPMVRADDTIHVPVKLAWDEEWQARRIMVWFVDHYIWLDGEDVAQYWLSKARTWYGPYGIEFDVAWVNWESDDTLSDPEALMEDAESKVPFDGCMLWCFTDQALDGNLAGFADTVDHTLIFKFYYGPSNTLVHEIGHLFHLEHCVREECIMHPIVTNYALCEYHTCGLDDWEHHWIDQIPLPPSPWDNPVILGQHGPGCGQYICPMTGVGFAHN